MKSYSIYCYGIIECNTTSRFSVKITVIIPNYVDVMPYSILASFGFSISTTSDYSLQSSAEGWFMYSLGSTSAMFFPNYCNVTLSLLHENPSDSLLLTKYTYLLLQIVYNGIIQYYLTCSCLLWQHIYELIILFLFAKFLPTAVNLMHNPTSINHLEICIYLLKYF